jgi:hypothetical protein
MVVEKSRTRLKQELKLLFRSRKNVTIILSIFLILLFIFNTILVSSSGFLSLLKYQIYKHDPGTDTIVYVEGIPYVDYGYKKNEYIGMQISPLTIVREALDNLTIYYDENVTNALNFCYTIADWLLNNKIVMQGPHWENSTLVSYYMWVYNYSFPYAKKYLENPWFSALAQGHIIDFFEQLYLISGNNTYRTAAFYSLNGLQVRIEDKGLLIIEGSDLFWLPEIAEIYKPDSRRYILGGFMHTIQNLLHVYDITNSSEMKQTIEILTNNSINNLKDKLELYNHKDVWTFYDRLGNPTASSYHERNTELIGWLYNRTGDSYFYDYWEEWSTTPYEEYPRDFVWYFVTYFRESIKYWWFTILVSLGISITGLTTYIVVRMYRKRRIS